MKNGTVQSRVKINEGEQYIVNIVPHGQPCFAMGSPVFLEPGLARSDLTPICKKAIDESDCQAAEQWLRRKDLEVDLLQYTG